MSASGEVGEGAGGRGAGRGVIHVQLGVRIWWGECGAVGQAGVWGRQVCGQAGMWGGWEEVREGEGGRVSGRVLG